MGIPGESLFYELGKILLSKAKDCWKGRTQDQYINALRKAQEAFRDERILRFLEWKYQGEQILERCGYRYPVAIYQAPEIQKGIVDSVLGSLHRYIPPDDDFIVWDAKYRSLISPLELLLESPTMDRLTYTMRSLVTDGKLQLECELGSYFRALDTCDALEWEILSNATQLVGKDESAFRAFDAKLPLRKSLHDAVANPVIDGTGRSAAIGISTLIAFNDGSRFQLLIRRRSERGVAVHAGLLHVIPSFMFQPATVNIPEEFSVQHNIFREYLEELFSRSEPEDTEGDYRYFYGDPRLKYLRALISVDKVKLLLTGVAVNLLNLRPEICTLLLIQSPEWYEKSSEEPQLRWHFNEEFASILNRPNRPEELVGRVPLSQKDMELLQSGFVYPSRTVPSGAAAFWLGVDTLRSIFRDL